MSDLRADEGQLRAFVDALFRYATDGTFISLRGFSQFNRASPPICLRPLKVNGSLDAMLVQVTAAAEDCAQTVEPSVFAPPLCTFSNPYHAAAADLANGLTLSVDIDHVDPEAARARLEGLLGPATVIVQSGSDWTDPTTGEVKPNLHLHWRLSEPTTTPAEHEALRQARTIAATLIGADPSGSSIVHPLRWPGSWHRKATPRLATATVNDAAEINLVTALDALEGAMEAEGRARAEMPASGTPEAPLRFVASAVAAIPNAATDVPYDQWIRIGYAIHRATGGSPEGADLWDQWSGKSSKYVAAETAATWRRIGNATAGKAPPRTIGAGTLFYLADRAGWVRPFPFNGHGDGRGASDADADWFARQGKDGDAGGFPATAISASEFADIPPREKVYGHFLFKKFISALGAPGGSGKTAYAFVVALAVATGQDLLGEGVHDPGPVWIYNLEDPRTELLRRIKAAVIGHGLQFTDIDGRLYLDSGRDRPLVVAEIGRDGMIIARPEVPAMVAEIKARGIKLLIVDPFVRSHRVEENANDQIDFVAALWAKIADEADCAVLLVHHFRKGGVSGDAAAFRGASAMIDASRGAVTLSVMSSDDASKMGVEEAERWRHVRVDNAKLNLAPPPAAAMWLALSGVDIGNATPLRPADSVQTVHRWEAESPFDHMPTAVVVDILHRLNDGPGDGEQYFLTGATTARWAGNVIMDVAGKAEGQAKAILAQWKRAGLIRASRYDSPSLRREASGLTVNMVMVSEM